MLLNQGDRISLTLPDYPEKYGEYIRDKVASDSIEKGSELKVTKISS